MPHRQRAQLHVGRSPRPAWLNYDDGKLYKSRTNNNPGFVLDSGYQTGVVPTARGMALCPTAPAARVETLYLAFVWQPVAAVEAQPLDAAPLLPSKIGTFATSTTFSRDDGTGAAELYAYFPAADASHRIIRVNKTSAQADVTLSAPGAGFCTRCVGLCAVGRAFRRVCHENSVSCVYRYDPTQPGQHEAGQGGDNLATNRRRGRVHLRPTTVG